jgi:hypothetical protein
MSCACSNEWTPVQTAPCRCGRAAYGYSGRAASYGNAADDINRVLGNLLGGVGAQAAGQIIDDPKVQATIQQATEDCKVKAEEGVNDWMKKNWGYLVAGAAGLVGLQLALNVVALEAYLPKRDLTDVLRTARGKRRAR